MMKMLALVIAAVLSIGTANATSKECDKIALRLTDEHLTGKLSDLLPAFDKLAEACELGREAYTDNANSRAEVKAVMSKYDPVFVAAVMEGFDLQSLIEQGKM